MSYTQAQIQAPISKKYEKKMYRTRDESILDTTATLTLVSILRTKHTKSLPKEVVKLFHKTLYDDYIKVKKVISRLPKVLSTSKIE